MHFTYMAPSKHYNTIDVVLLRIKHTLYKRLFLFFSTSKARAILAMGLSYSDAGAGVKKLLRSCMGKRQVTSDKQSPYLVQEKRKIGRLVDVPKRFTARTY